MLDKNDIHLNEYQVTLKLILKEKEFLIPSEFLSLNGVDHNVILDFTVYYSLYLCYAMI